MRLYIIILYVVAAFLGRLEVVAKTPVADFGRIDRLVLRSDALEADFTIDVWLPSDYSESGERYPVLYMQDGQNLFDSESSFSSVAWEMDRVVTSLAESGKITTTPVIVGIHNRGADGLRANDYFPQKAIDYIADEDRDKTSLWQNLGTRGALGDEYARFIAEILKPVIDSHYNVSTDRESTVAMGSSMGALMSLYLLCEYPNVFGASACLSTHWVGSLSLNSDFSMNDDPVCARALLDYLDDNLPDMECHRLYMDQGSEGWDAGYIIYEDMAREIVSGHNPPDGNFMTNDVPGAGHNEWFWQQRVDVPLTFLYRAESSGAESGVVVDPYFSVENFYFDMQGRNCGSDPRVLSKGIYIYNHRKIIKR